MSRLSMIFRVNVVLIRTVAVDSDWRFNNLCASHPQSQLLVVCEISRDVIGYEDL